MKSLATLVLLFWAAAAVAQDHLIAVMKGGKWGFVDGAGETKIDYRFDEAWAFDNGVALAVEKGQFGLIDKSGKWHLAKRPGKPSGDFSFNRIICADEKGKWGAIDRKGKVQVPFVYDALSGFLGNWAITGMKTSDPLLMRVSVVDSLGRSPVTFDNIYLPSSAFTQGKRVRDGYITVLVDGDYGSSLNAYGSTQLEGRPLYIALFDIRNKRLVNMRVPSLLAEVREGRYNFSAEGISYSLPVPLSAEPAISESRFSFLAETIFPFSSAIAAINKNGNWAFLDKDGSLLSETNLPVADYVNEIPLYSGGYVTFRKKSGEWIYTDLTGAQRIALEFDEVTSFQYGGAVVKYKGKFGLVQKDGTWALQPVYDAIRY